MNYITTVAACFLIGLAPAARIAFAQSTSNAEGCVLIKQKCKPTLKQTKFGFEFGGIDFSSGPVSKVGSVKLSTDLIQKLTDVAQILDQMQLTRCQQLNVIRACDAVREKLLIVQAVGAEQLGQLAILAQIYSGSADKLQDAMLKWIVASTDTIQKIYAKQFMSADPQIEANQNKARSALEYAVARLKASPNDLERLTQNPLRSELQ